MKALKVIGLAIAAATLTGCATGMSDKEYDEGDNSKSYAWNVEQHMLGPRKTDMKSDPNWDKLDLEMLDPKNGYYLYKNSSYAAHRATLEEDLRLSSTSENASYKVFAAGSITNDVGSIVGGNAATAGALTGIALMAKAFFGTNGYVEPVMDYWLHDQILIFVPVKKFAKGNDADHYVVDSIKKAVAKAGKNYKIIEETDCTLIRVIVSDPEIKNPIIKIEQHRFQPGTDPRMPQCKREVAKDTNPGYLPGWMNHGVIDEWAWYNRVHGCAIIGSQRNKIAAIAKYLPDNFYIYIAPRIDDKTKKVVHPVVIDNKGMHEFIAPVSAK